MVSTLGHTHALTYTQGELNSLMDSFAPQCKQKKIKQLMVCMTLMFSRTQHTNGSTVSNVLSLLGLSSHPQEHVHERTPAHTTASLIQIHKQINHLSVWIEQISARHAIWLCVHTHRNTTSMTIAWLMWWNDCMSWQILKVLHFSTQFIYFFNMRKAFCTWSLAKCPHLVWAGVFHVGERNNGNQRSDLTPCCCSKNADFQTLFFSD